jgi:hypothetical protein
MANSLGQTETAPVAVTADGYNAVLGSAVGYAMDGIDLLIVASCFGSSAPISAGHESKVLRWSLPR